MRHEITGQAAGINSLNEFWAEVTCSCGYWKRKTSKSATVLDSIISADIGGHTFDPVVGLRTDLAQSIERPSSSRSAAPASRTRTKRQVDPATLVAGVFVAGFAVLAVVIAVLVVRGVKSGGGDPISAVAVNDQDAEESAWSACQVKFRDQHPGAALTEDWTVNEPFASDPAQGKMRVAVRDVDDRDLAARVIGHVTCWVNPLTGAVNVKNVSIPNGY